MRKRKLPLSETTTLLLTKLPRGEPLKMCIPESVSIKDSLLARVIALPSIKYNGRVEADVFESRLGRGETGHERACRDNNN